LRPPFVQGDTTVVLYNNWLGDITERFQKKFDDIKVVYNFEYGEEFEMAIADALRELLPQRYGVCRGYVVSRDGQSAGDDIIIFDAQHFPTLRALERTDLSRKENVPAEAVLAYIEAKHTLQFAGEGGQSLSKAVDQVRRVKEVPRPPVPHSEIIPGVNLPAQFSVTSPPYMPQIRNPYYGAIWARNVGDAEPEQPWMPASEVENPTPGRKPSWRAVTCSFPES
jgi:hypothetical protein